MPFGFLKRRPQEGPAATGGPAPEMPAADSRAPRRISVEAFTDEWRLRGSLVLVGRLIDALNLGEALAVEDVTWAPVDGSSGFEPAPGIKSLDPYEVVLVLATAETLGPMTDDERRAHVVHKIRFDVAVEAPPYRILGTVRLRPGNAPEGLFDRGAGMFFAMTEPVVELGGAPIDLGGATDAVLVNRFYMRGIGQVDRVTGMAVEPLPEIGGPGEG